MIEPIMAAPAMAGLKPARTMSGIIVGPRAAAQPAADGMAMATQEAMSMQKGRRKMPRRPSGFTIRPTKSTRRVSMRLRSAAIVSRTIKPAIQIVQVML